MNALARHSDPDTSHEAAASVDIPNLECRVLAALEHFETVGGATTEQIATYLRMPRDSISPRMRRLVALGWAIDTNIREKGHSGRSMIVWSAAT